jgi:hypothetical protein
LDFVSHDLVFVAFDFAFVAPGFAFVAAGLDSGAFARSELRRPRSRNNYA